MENYSIVTNYLTKASSFVFHPLNMHPPYRLRNRLPRTGINLFFFHKQSINFPVQSTQHGERGIARTCTITGAREVLWLEKVKDVNSDRRPRLDAAT